MLVVNPWHWLKEDGSLPDEMPRLRRNVLRIARFIEYAGSILDVGEAQSTLVECVRRPERKPCLGLMVVIREEDHLAVVCPACKRQEAAIYEWETTPWASGPPLPIQLVP